MSQHSKYSLKRRGYCIVVECDSLAEAAPLTAARRLAGEPGARVFKLANGKHAVCAPIKLETLTHD